MTVLTMWAGPRPPTFAAVSGLLIMAMADADDLTWDEVHHALIPMMRADNRTNLGYILLEYVALVVVMAGCVWSYVAWSGGRLSTASFVPLAALGVVLIAAVQHRFSGLAHDASHYTLFKDKLANELVSDLLLMFPIMAMTQRFRATHMGHHQYVNDPARDPDLIRLNQPVPEHFPMAKARFWYRYVGCILWPPTLLRYLYGQAKNANVGEGPASMRSVYRFRLGRCLRGTFWLTVLTAVHALHVWPIFFLFWVLPLLTAYPLMMQLREIAHHSNAPDDGNFTNSRIFRVHPILNACVFPYGQDFHVTHHLFAMLPHYRMAEAHEILMRYRPYREQVVVCRGFFFRSLGTEGPSVLDVLSRARDAGLQHREGPPHHPGDTALVSRG